MVNLENISKIYQSPKGQVAALDNINFQVGEGRFVVLKGPSGSGKTTLLMMIGAMLRPTTGKVVIGGENIYGLNTQARAHFRRQNIGFVFQMFHLLPYLNILDNVLLAGSDNKAKANDLLHKLGLADRLSHRPAELSAGEKQRVAIARAMLNSPKLVLADEPTGNLDPKNADDVIKHLAQFRDNGSTVIVATHQESADNFADRVIQLQSGQVIDS